MSNIFTLLSETPIEQIGMNYTANIKVNKPEGWVNLGKNIAPHEHWLQAADYINKLPKEKQEGFGLLSITMNLPRNDDYNGQIRPNLHVTSPVNRELRFNINNHINIDSAKNTTVTDIINDCWEHSLTTGKELISNVLDLNLQDIK